MTTDPTAARARFTRAALALDTAYRELRDACLELPELPAPAVSIDEDDDPDTFHEYTYREYDLWEGGITRQETMTRDGDHCHAASRGWDAYSEEGRFTYLEDSDGLAWRVPENVDWD